MPQQLVAYISEPDAQSFQAMLGELLNDPQMLRIVNA